MSVPPCDVVSVLSQNAIPRSARVFLNYRSVNVFALESINLNRYWKRSKSRTAARFSEQHVAFSRVARGWLGFVEKSS